MIKKRVVEKIIHLLIVTFVLFGLIVDGSSYLAKAKSSTLFQLVNYFSYFTILSNISLALSCAILIIHPQANSIRFRALRLNAIVCMLITAIIFNIFLRPGYVPSGLISGIINELSHVINPLLGLLSYLFFDPKPILNKRIIRLAITPPLLYAAYVLIRGYFTGFYPYYFLNFHKVGIVTPCLFVICSIGLFLVLSLILSFIEQRIVKTTHQCEQ